MDKVLGMALALEVDSQAKAAEQEKTVPGGGRIQTQREEFLLTQGRVAQALESMELRPCPEFPSKVETVIL